MQFYAAMRSMAIVKFSVYMRFVRGSDYKPQSAGEQLWSARGAVL